MKNTMRDLSDYAFRKDDVLLLDTNVWPGQEKELHARHAELAYREGDGIGTDSEERGVAEGEEAHISKQQIEAETGDGEDYAEDQQHGLVGARELREDRKRERDHRTDAEQLPGTETPAASCA